MILVALLFSHFSCSPFPVEFMMHFDWRTAIFHNSERFRRNINFCDCMIANFGIYIKYCFGIRRFFRLFCLLTCFRVLCLSSIISGKWITITITLKASCVPTGSDSYKTPIANQKQVRTRTGKWLVRRRGMSPDDSPS